MKRMILSMLLLAGTVCAQELSHATLDSGGGRGTGGVITNDASLGDLGDSLHDSAPLTARPGFVGQLWDAAALAVTPQPAAMSDSSTLQLTTHLIGDDTTTQPTTTSVTWLSDNVFLSVSATGLLTVGTLLTDDSATVTASSGDLIGSAFISLLDFNPDDYDPFARDGLNDAWQAQWFANDPAAAAPGLDGDGDGQNNLQEFYFGTSPLDASSLMLTRIEPVLDAPTEKRLIFDPWLPDRIYTWEWTDDLTAPWSVLPSAVIVPQPAGDAHTLDSAATEPRKFYRLRVE